MDIPRIGVKELRRKMTAAHPPLLVCAYEGEDRFRDLELEGAISWESFRSMLPGLPPDREIVFYCA